MVPFRERNEDLQRSDEDLQRGSEINSDEVISINNCEVFALCGVHRRGFEGGAAVAEAVAFS